SFTQVIYPAIDPLTHKNRPLSVHKTTGILANAGLLPGNLRIITPQFEHKARVLKPDGNFSVMDDSENGNLLYQPLLTQISRWDRLKGFQALMKAFVELKSQSRTAQDTRHQKRLELVKLVLAGPDPAFIADDPEGLQVLEELKSEYLKLPKEVQKDLYLVLLPMNSAKENALIVNCLQRISTIVIQNSIREGFGLTATEAMWKSVPVLVSGAFGLTKQVRDQVEGRIHNNAEDYIGLSKVLDEMLFDARGREIYAYNGLSRVVDQFLVFKQLTHWLDVLGSDGFVRNKN
ncbi:MAG: glycosyltransferase, partial [Leptospiraceae bacterium]|nr:glycosyltransferase [Leptospiraceae bacterium]